MAVLLEFYPTLNQVRSIPFELAATTTTHRNLQLPGQQSPCTGSPTNLNMLNSSVQASQSGYIGWSPFNFVANEGCDGIIQLTTVNGVLTAIVSTQESGSPHFWVAEFKNSVTIQTILVIYRNKDVGSNFQIRVGDNTDYFANPECTSSTVVTGGWYTCAATGKFLAITSQTETGWFRFFEVMAYTQEAIQMFAKSAILSSTLTDSVTYLCTTGTNCQASNVLLNYFEIQNNWMNSSNGCCMYSSSQMDPTMTVTLNADIQIDAVILIPSQQTSEANDWQQNVEVYIVNAAGVVQLCGTLQNYNTYQEMPCKMIGNKVIVKRPGSNMILSMAGLGILSSCDCSKSLLDPKLISLVVNPFASTTLVNTTSTGAPVKITFSLKMPDTVSSVCGYADGFSKCAPARVLTFKDKMTKKLITFPYKGIQLDSASSVLTLNPAQAAAICVLTATLQLANYPTVTYSQDITLIVSPVVIPPLSLNATVNEQAYLQLPNYNFTYVVQIKPTFEASIDGNLLKVFSTNEKDVGTQWLYLDAKNNGNSQSFKVKINFKATQTPATNITTQPVQNASNSTNLTSSNDLVDFSKMNCTTDENDNLKTCVSLINSRFTCQFDEVTGEIVCGLDLKLKQDKTDQPLNQPTMVISEINKRGLYDLTFSKPMNFSSLLNTGADRKGGGRSSGYSAQATSEVDSTNKTDFNRNLYFLSDQHLNITLLSGGDQDDSKKQFEWFALNITATKIRIQVLFEHPAYISTDAHSPDYLHIQLLPSSLMVFQSIQSHQHINKPLRTEKKRVPTQLKLDKVTDNVEAAAQNLSSVTTWTVIGNFSLSIFLSGVLGRIFTMANSLQMLMASCRLNVAVPANVYLVTQKVNDVASFNLLPADQIMAYFFNFSTTVSPNVAFQAMGALSMRLTPYLGSIFIAMVLVFGLSLFYGITYPCRNLEKVLSRVHKKMKANYYWSGIIRLILEGFSDLCTGIMLSINDPHFDTGSDIFDFALTCFFALVVIAGPISAYLLLRKYDTQLDEEEFQTNFGSLTQGYYTTGVIGTSKTRKIIVWYMLRRIFTAVVIVQMDDLSPWLQITANIYLALADAIINQYCFAYLSQMGGIIATFNDFVVLILSYFPYLSAGLVPDPEARYQAGWIQASLLGLMLVVNLTVVGISMVIEITTELRRIGIERHNFQELKRLGYDVVAVGMAPWQIISRLCQLDWLCFDGVPRLNVQIVDQMREYYRQLSEQIEMLNMYFNTRANQHVLNQEIRQIQHDAYQASQDQEIGFAQTLSQISNNQVVPSQLLQTHAILAPITAAAEENQRRADWMLRNVKRASLPESQLIAEQAAQVKHSRDKSITAAAEENQRRADWMVNNVKRASLPESQLVAEAIEVVKQSQRAIGSTEWMIQDVYGPQEVDRIARKHMMLEVVKDVLYNLRNSRDSELRQASKLIDEDLIVSVLPYHFLEKNHSEQIKEVRDLLFMLKEDEKQVGQTFAERHKKLKEFQNWKNEREQRRK